MATNPETGYTVLSNDLREELLTLYDFEWDYKNNVVTAVGGYRDADKPPKSYTIETDLVGQIARIRRLLGKIPEGIEKKNASWVQIACVINGIRYEDKLELLPVELCVSVYLWQLSLGSKGNLLQQHWWGPFGASKEHMSKAKLVAEEIQGALDQWKTSFDIDPGDQL